MTDSASTKPAKKEDNFVVFLIKLVLFVALLRSLVFSPFTIPSESMLPRLENGDYLLAEKWPYGFSSYSLWPNVFPHWDGRVLGRQPARGEVVIFKAPPANEQDWIKRVIGLPGDTIQMQDGVLHINGKAVPKVRIADFEVPVSDNTHCPRPEFEGAGASGTRVCRYPRFRETLPEGKSYDVLDFGPLKTTPVPGFDADNTQAYVVPEGALFLMGDNRDNSMDSRFSTADGGVSFVPQDNLVGRATIVLWSTDGSASWLKPWTWFTAARWHRIGGLF